MADQAAAPVADTTPVASATPAAESAPAPSLLSDGAAPPADQTPADSKPADGAAPAEKPKSLLTDNDDGKTPSDADAPSDANKGDTPAEYQSFTLPEGLTLDEAALAKAVPVFKDLKLDQESAQKLVSFYAEQVKASNDALVQEQIAHQQRTIDEWRAATAADKEIGGDKLAQNLGIAKKAWNALATPAMREMFDDWGISNHPEVVRFLYRVGSKLSEDTFVPNNGAPQTKAQTLAGALYEQ